jgi:pyruvate formate lyase activating enzyme
MSDILVCGTCPHHCRLAQGQTGFCRGRANINGKIIPVNYGKFTSIALDPIEKKPFARFMPGSKILSVGSFGCNLACPFCQNFEISQASESGSVYRELTPEQLADAALSLPDNIGIAFTYNEPLISWEYIRDTGSILKEKSPDMKIAVVTNGMASRDVIDEISPFVDAMNIDLKGDRDFYRDELKGDLDTVRETIEAQYRRCHVEVTTLVIPGRNDSEEWMREEASWLASLDDEIPLHLSRYFPRWHYSIPATPRETILKLKDIAGEYLKYVYTGNMW